MLVEVLKRFHEQQNGPSRFELPGGDEIDLRSKHDKIRVTKWILAKFGGDDAEASSKVEELAKLAIAKARAPWPYLVRSISNAASEVNSRPSFGSTTKEIAKHIKAHFGRARVDLLADIKASCGDEHSVTVDGRILKLAEQSDRVYLYNWLLSQHALQCDYEFFALVSPQFLHRYNRDRGFQQLVEDLRTVVAISGEQVDGSAASLLKDLFQDCLKSRHDEYQRDDSELGLCIKLCAGHCSRFFHPSFSAVHLPHRKGFCTLSDKQVRDAVVGLLRDACQRDLDSPRALWVRQALNYGVITNPVSYLLSLAEYDIDPVEDWMATDCESVKAMTEDYGFQTVPALFPELVVHHVH